MITIIEKRNIKILSLITILLVTFFLYMTSFLLYAPVRVHPQNYSNPQIRIYCLILTAPKYFATRARAVNSTWAPRCDEFSFISEYSNDTKGLPIAPIANISSGYEHLTQKMILAWHYVYKNYFNDYDWFLKADDDTYIFMENLKSFLKEQNSSEPITFGYNFKVLVKDGFHSGGGGYVLSREAVKRLYQAYNDPNITCSKDGSAEDLNIAACLRKKGVYPGKSVDKYNRERFHPLPFSDHFLGPIPSWLFGYAANKPVSGSNCCSDTTISFHYVTPEQQYLIDKMHYGFHEKT